MKAMLIAVVVSFVGAASADAAPKSMPSGKVGVTVKIGHNCYPSYPIHNCYPKVVYPCYPTYPVYPVQHCVYIKKVYFAPLQCEIFWLPTYNAWCYLHPLNRTYIPLRGINGLPSMPIEALQGQQLQGLQGQQLQGLQGQQQGQVIQGQQGQTQGQQDLQNLQGEALLQQLRQIQGVQGDKPVPPIPTPMPNPMQ
jgi:hypothetical protein